MLEAGSASTSLAASVPFHLVFPRNFAASYIVFCSLQSLAHQQLSIWKPTIWGFPETKIDALLFLFNLRCLDCLSISLEIKFCFCNEASFGFSASEPFFVFAASNVSGGRSTAIVSSSPPILSATLSIKFCFCDEASFGFSASKAFFCFSASEASLVLLLLVSALPRFVSPVH